MLGKHISLCALLFALLVAPYSKAQKTVVANTSLNVLYAGIPNTLDILSEGIVRINLEVYSKDFEISDSNGHFYVNIPKHPGFRETFIKVRDKSKRDNIWTDSLYFRVKNIPRPIGQLGTLPSGGSFHYGEIAMQHTLYAYLDGFVFDGVRYTVVSYQVHACNLQNLEITHLVQSGNSAEPIRQFVASNRSQSSIKIDKIRAVLVNRITLLSDTIELEPISYFIKGTIPNAMHAEFREGSTLKVLKLNSDFNKDTIYGHARFLYEVKGNDTIPLARRQDSANQLLSFKRYYYESPGRLKLDVQKISDSSYFIRYFNSKGICIAEGKALNFQFDVYNWNWFGGVRATFNNKIDSIHYFMGEQQLNPFGEWKFYHAEGQLLALGYYKAIPQKKEVKKDEFEHMTFVCGSFVDTFNSIGLWKVFDTQGKLIEERDFSKKK